MHWREEDGNYFYEFDVKHCAGGAIMDNEKLAVGIVGNGNRLVMFGFTDKVDLAKEIVESAVELNKSVEWWSKNHENWLSENFPGFKIDFVHE